MEAVLSRNPWESNECLFNSTPAPRMPLITELIVVADEATDRSLSNNKDCVGKIKSVIEEMINGVLSPLSRKKNRGVAAEAWIGRCGTDVLPQTTCAGPGTPKFKNREEETSNAARPVVGRTSCLKMSVCFGP